MAISVQFDPSKKQFRFDQFSTTPLDYREDNPENDPTFLQLKVTDVKTQQISTVFFNEVALESIGISLTVWKGISDRPVIIKSASKIDCLLKKAIPVVSKQLEVQHLKFFSEMVPWAIRAICSSAYAHRKHSSCGNGLPGIYFHYIGDKRVDVFINLKKTPPLGEGSYGKVRKVLWLNTSKIVAKKVLKENTEIDIASFHREVAAFREFVGKRGIIPCLCCDLYDDKYALFFPIYESNLDEWFHNQQFPLSQSEILSVISQLLDGLAAINEKGMHCDIKPKNILLNRGEQGIEAVIADFGAYCSHGKKEYGNSTIKIAPPEYFANKCVSSKHDVWSMGISLHQFFSKECPPCWNFGTEQGMESWTAQLTPGWIRKFPFVEGTPDFIVTLLDEMLDPRVDTRPTAKVVFERFSVGYATISQNK